MFGIYKREVRSTDDADEDAPVDQAPFFIDNLIKIVLSHSFQWVKLEWVKGRLPEYMNVLSI